ncbi:xanthine/CO dehydrogenase XdhC/CoxF family maturation factor [Neobacillus niacini]|uniref:XdhC family protein n=1 Tax=Neobacillus niacini TaxID=86668 RepID=UPI0028610CAC|nr:XdhC family protein [Neobacillus niacini]MDR7079339.1 xanthine/CO dehydrogenase XdhC/CoxF family maturation factor [Neobacillus niacini]
MSQLKEFRTIMNSIKSVWEKDKKASIVMLIGVNGSAYRLPGTKMMMAEDAEMMGTISGGCLEGDIYGYAEKALQKGTPTIKNYDLSDNEIWSLGIGCKGSLEILILPAKREDPFWDITDKLLNDEEEFSFIIEIQTGVKAIVTKYGDIIGDSEFLPSVVYESALKSLKSQKRAEIVKWKGCKFVVDVIRPSQKLIVAGAGKDAIPVVEFAAKAGFSVTVLDPRSEFNKERYFPVAQHLVELPENINPENVSNAWWVIMNHLQSRDEEALHLALKSNPKYIGVLGPVSRTQEMILNIGEDLTIGEDIFSPVGLDIGAETMEEVAISIVSELMAVRSNRDGKSLKGKLKIHA